MAKSLDSKNASLMCYCGANQCFSVCCAPLLKQDEQAKTAEALMRSRYVAFVLHNTEYLFATCSPKQQKNYNALAIKTWVSKITWTKLEIINTWQGKAQDKRGKVEFKAYYEEEGVHKVHHELSRFHRLNHHWVYWDALFMHDQKMLS